MTTIKNTKDLIVLLLAAKGASKQPNEPISGRTRLMKMLFLFDKELKAEFKKANVQVFEDTALPIFEAYDYGPFSSEVYADLEWLVNMGFVDVQGERVCLSDSEMEEDELHYWGVKNDEEESTSRTKGDVFKLSERGVKFVEAMKPKWGITDKQKLLLDEFKGRCTKVSLQSLLTYVYQKYPETTSKSKIRDKILHYDIMPNKTEK